MEGFSFQAIGAMLAAVPTPLKTDIHLPSGESFSVRLGKTEDVSGVTRLIHAAFSIWKEQGLTLGPMNQTDDETAAHLVSRGYVVEDRKGALVGTFSLGEGLVKRTGKTTIRFREDGDSIECFRIGSNQTILPSGRLLVFRKAAVALDAAKSGLGSKLYTLAEGFGRENGYSGMVLQTVKEAGWLYDWYVRLGFKPIGTYRYPGREVDTILMIKSFG